MPDWRDPDRIRHAIFLTATARVSAIACGLEEAIALDRLRHDPLMRSRSAVGAILLEQNDE